MRSLLQDIRFGFRILFKNPGFTMIAVVTLALGIGANTTIFSIVNGVVLQSLPYEEPDQLFMLWERNPQKGLENEKVTPPNFAEWQAQSRNLEVVAYWTGGWRSNWIRPAGTEKVNCYYVSSTLFPLLRINPFMGRTFLPEEDLEEGSRTAVISYDFWQRRLAGEKNAIGKTLVIDTYGRREYTIVGVMPAGFCFPANVEIWLPAGWNGLPRQRDGHWLEVLGRLKKGVTQEQAQAELSAIQFRRLQQHPDRLIGSEVTMVPLLEQTLGRDLQTALWVLWGVVTCVLLIACANVANLLLSRAVTRQKEIALRITLGAGRWRIVRQLLTESVILAFSGGILGVLLALWSIDLFTSLGAAFVPRIENVKLDGQVLAFTGLASILAGLLFGMAPLWQFLKPQLNETLKDSSRGVSGNLAHCRLRSGLVIAEISLSILLLTGAGLLTKSFIQLTQMDRGFQSDNLMAVELDFSISGFTTWVQPTVTRPQVTLQEMMERIRLLPGVQSISAISAVPRTIGNARTQGVVFDNDASQLANHATANFQGIETSFFQTLGVSLLQGRNFTELDTLEAPAVAIVNETFVRRYYPNENPIGKLFAMKGFTSRQSRIDNRSARTSGYEIVGVVADMKKLNWNGDAVPDVFVPYWQWPMQTPALFIRTSQQPSVLIPAIRREILAVNKNLPEPVFQTLNEILSDAVAQPRFHTLLSALFGIIALLLSTVGIYGVISNSVVQRTHEIGIRMALGAKKEDVLRMILKQGMWITGTGVAIGIALALASTRVLSALLYNVTPTDPLTFALVSLLLVLVALFACVLPAWRAAQVDPMVALRYD